LALATMVRRMLTTVKDHQGLGRRQAAAPRITYFLHGGRNSWCPSNVWMLSGLAAACNREKKLRDLSGQRFER